MNNKKLKKKLKQLSQDLFRCQGKLMFANKLANDNIGLVEVMNKQLNQQDLYLNRKDQEFNVLKRMYRDDIINNYVEPRHE